MNEKNRRKTVCLISETGFDTFQSEILEGVVKAARENDLCLVRFAMESAQIADSYSHQFDYVFDRMGRMELDGIIFLGWMSTVVKNPEAFLERVRRVGDLPLVSLGSATHGVPSFCIDGERHMRELLSHLTDVHDYKNIVFVQPYTPDDRYPLYETFMKERSLFRPELVVRREELEVGKDFYAVRRASRICEILFDERKLSVDAVVSLYTYESSFLLEECLRRGFRVPEDLAVTGWEDGDRSKYADPAITSVYFPFFEIGYAAGLGMVRLLAGEEVPPVNLVPAMLNIRASCGCTPPDIQKKTDRRDAPKLARATAETIRKEYDRHAEYTFEILEIDGLIGLLFASAHDLYDRLPALIGACLAGMKITVHILNALDCVERDILRFQRFIRSCPVDATLQRRAEELSLRVLLLLQQKTEREIGFYGVLKRGASFLLQDINTRLVTTFDFKELKKIIIESLEKISIQNCSLYLKRDPSDWRSKEDLFLCIHNGVACDGRVGGSTAGAFPPGPPDIHSSLRYYVFLLHINQELLGVLFIEPTETDERTYLTLSIQLSSALYESETLRRLTDTNQTLDAAKTEISNNLTVIREKTRELEELNKKLSELDVMKNEFIANVTHDFRSPLMVILNLTDLSIKYFDTMEPLVIRERLSTVLEASTRLKTTIARLLEIAKMDARGLRLAIQPLPLCLYLKNIVDFYRSAVITSHIEIQCRLPDREVDDFYTDPDKLDEILNNLISNAVKFVDPDAGRIIITLADHDQSVEIVIEDNGVGIPPDKLEAIFNRFEQLESGRNAAVKGSGIGLAFARQAAGLLQGELTAESEGEGKGSRFVLRLPKGRNVFENSAVHVVFDDRQRMIPSEQRSQFKRLIESDLRDLKTRHAVLVPPAPEHDEDETNIKKMLILIIDDNPAIVDIITHYLLQAGYTRFITAFDGREGMNAVYAYKPDLIISDYNMPLVRGDELHETLLLNPELKRIPILFISAVSDRKMIMERATKGPIAFLQKPIHEHALLESLEQLLYTRREDKELLARLAVDPLTGCMNRRAVRNRAVELLMIRRYRPFSVLLFDIDALFGINQRGGYPAGDAVIRETGEFLMAVLRSCDKVGRWDDGAFLILLPETPLARARFVAARLQRGLKNLKPSIVGANVPLTACVGIASLIESEATLARDMQCDDLRSLFEPVDASTADWTAIDEAKRRIADGLIRMAASALARAKTPTCSACGADQPDETSTGNTACRVCGETAVITGRDRVRNFDE